MKVAFLLNKQQHKRAIKIQSRVRKAYVKYLEMCPQFRSDLIDRGYISHREAYFFANGAGHFDSLESSLRSDDHWRRSLRDPAVSLSYLGDATSPHSHGYSFNFNQSLNYNQRTRILTYEGERHPLHQDGIAESIAEIADAHKPYIRDGEIRYHQGKMIMDPDLEAAASKLEMVKYETSQKNWQWWWTELDYLSTLEPEELGVYCMINGFIPKYYSDYGRMYAEDFGSLAEFRKEVEKLVKEKGGKLACFDFNYSTGYDPNNLFKALQKLKCLEE